MNNKYKQGKDRIQPLLFPPSIDDYVDEDNTVRADFRKNNPKALKQVFKEFVILCKNINLIDGKLTVVDGAFLRANDSKNQLIMKSTLVKDLRKITEEIEEYFKTLDYSDKQKQPLNIASKLPKDLSDNLKLLESMDKTQYNRTDPDASLMRKPAHSLMAYALNEVRKCPWSVIQK